MLEIEAKIKVGSLKQIVNLLECAGAKFLGDSIQNDSFFDDAQKKLKNQGSGLRLRVETLQACKKAVLTLKGPKQHHRFKARKEDEIEMSPEDIMKVEDMLSGLGFSKFFEYEKKRQMWELDECSVCLDSVPLLGDFVEVEGPGADEIEAVIVKLGLSGSEHINAGYAKLLKNKLKELGVETDKVEFDK
ncbi:MAG: class IV adenylate cyclase [Sedimentisphaerales bacterium]|nr:class IV adenylate cyclase [Sedimentisphaerales bacterium]